METNASESSRTSRLSLPKEKSLKSRLTSVFSVNMPSNRAPILPDTVIIEKLKLMPKDGAEK